MVLEKCFAGFLLVLFFLAGCVGLDENIKGFKGTSTKTLEENKESSLGKVFGYSLADCQANVKVILSGMGAYIYSQDDAKKMIAFYISEKDTTPVGVFFEEVTAQSTRVLVSSASSFAKESIAEKLFSGIENSLKTKKVQVQLDSVEEEVKNVP